MLRSIVPLAALVAAPLAAQPTPALPMLASERQAALTCAAAFAIVASGQQRGERAALAFPPLASRGREYFVRFGATTIDTAGATRETVRAMLEAEVARLQREAAAGGDPDATIAAVMPACLARLEAEVPPLPTPTLAQCAAILALAYEEVHSREGLSASARDLKTLGAVLESREREALSGQGITGNAADRRLAETHDAMLKEALDAPAGVERYDLATCYELARPKEGGHY